MRRSCSALALLAAVVLWPHDVTAGGFDGGVSDNGSLSLTPLDFLGQADGCPYTANALYQEFVAYQRQTTSQPGQGSAGGPGANSAAGGSHSNAAALASNHAAKSKKKKKPTRIAATSKASKSAAVKGKSERPATAASPTDGTKLSLAGSSSTPSKLSN